MGDYVGEVFEIFLLGEACKLIRVLETNIKDERCFPSEYLVEEFLRRCLICAQYVDLHVRPFSRAFASFALAIPVRFKSKARASFSLMAASLRYGLDDCMLRSAS